VCGVVVCVCVCATDHCAGLKEQGARDLTGSRHDSGEDEGREVSVGRNREGEESDHVASTRVTLALVQVVDHREPSEMWTLNSPTSPPLPSTATTSYKKAQLLSVCQFTEHTITHPDCSVHGILSPSFQQFLLQLSHTDAHSQSPLIILSPMQRGFFMLTPVAATELREEIMRCAGNGTLLNWEKKDTIFAVWWAPSHNGRAVQPLVVEEAQGRFSDGVVAGPTS
jgi:hypothetical protein